MQIARKLAIGGYKIMKKKNNTILWNVNWLSGIDAFKITFS